MVLFQLGSFLKWRSQTSSEIDNTSSLRPPLPWAGLCSHGKSNLRKKKGSVVTGEFLGGECRSYDICFCYPIYPYFYVFARLASLGPLVISCCDKQMAAGDSEMAIHPSPHRLWNRCLH